MKTYNRTFNLKILSLTIFNLIILNLINLQHCSAQIYWNQAGNFPGTAGSHVAVPSSPSLNITGSFTLEALINPAVNFIIGKGIIMKGTGLGVRYGMRMTNGRITVMTNATNRLTSRASNTIPLNTWTHVAATFDSTTSVYSIYINGFLDTSATIPGSKPLSNPDSLIIGSNGSSTEFNGKIDDVRVWNTSLSTTQIFLFMKSSLGISGDGIYSNLILSIPFQNNTGTAPYFSAMDHSAKSNNGFVRNNVTAFDLKDKPSFNNQISDCIYQIFPGGFTALDNPAISPTNKLTLECWVYPLTDNFGIAYKGPFISGGPNQYGMKVAAGKLNADINSTTITSNDSVKKGRWSHVAFTYFGSTGAYEFYVNGKKGTTGNITPGNIIDGTDSLTICAHPTVAFTGFLDEFRISHTLKSASEISSQMFTSINESNDNDSYISAVYNLDASTLPSTDGAPRLNLRGLTNFTFNGAATIGLMQSPVNNISAGNFQSGFYMSRPDKRIPATGTTGTIKDTIEILSSETISDLNIFVALNHKAENNLRLSITSPLGASVEFFANTQLANSASNIITVFDSDADSALVSNRYINFGPKIKPQFDIDAIFSGNNPKGKWILTITDESGADTGFITSWGLQINNNPSLPFMLESTSLIEGFYNPATNLLIADTMRYNIRAIVSPYAIIDTSRALLNTSGYTIANFTKVQPNTDYFIELKHRNSIETWSSTTIKFTQFAKQASYNFSDLISKAFGNNMKQVDASPVRFAIYGGDVNKDGVVDATDAGVIDNDAFNFVTGYVNSDVTGDDVSDASDAAIADNNAANFVTSVTP